MKQKKAPVEPISDRRRELGARMRKAALHAGFRGEEAIAEKMGCRQPVISRWWSGRNTPKVEQMARYAELVQRPVWWFYVHGSDDGPDLVGDLLLTVVQMAEQSGDAAEAYERVTGNLDRLSHRDRRTITAGTGALLAKFREVAGGSLADLPLPAKRRVFQDLLNQMWAASPEDE